MRLLSRLLVAVFLIGVLFGNFAFANNAVAENTNQLFVYDGMAASPGPLDGTQSGFGWQFGWLVQNSNVKYAVKDTTPLTFPNLISTKEYAVGGGNWVACGRKMISFAPIPDEIAAYQNASNQFGKDGTTLWYSMLLRAETSGEKYFLLHRDTGNPGLPWNPTADPAIKIGRSGSNVWGIAFGTQKVATKKSFINGNTYLVVLKMDFTAAGGTVGLFINPDLSVTPVTPDATATVATTMAFNAINVNVGNDENNGAWDEIRLGNAYAAVAPMIDPNATPIPTPEPTPTPDPYATPKPTPVKILCIGDSITEGTSGVNGGAAELTYRYPLWKLLLDKDAIFEFVGTRSAGFEGTPTYPDYNGNIFSNKHEAHWGWSVAQVNDALTTPLLSLQPDLAIIYLGGGDPQPQAKENMRALIEKLRLKNPKIVVLLGEPFSTWRTEGQLAFRALATEMNTASSPVIAMRPPTGWVDDPVAVGSCTIDWVHTSLIGDKVLADHIFTYLAPFVGVVLPTATPTLVPTPSPTPTPTPVPVLVVNIGISKTTANMKVKQTLQLGVTLIPLNATNKAVIWASSNTKVASVSSTGKVTAKGPGTAAISVTSVSQSKKATCKVTVIQPVVSVKLSKSSITIKKGKLFHLTATIAPANASNKKVTWKSSNKALATVSATGVVRGIKKGTVYITATTVDGKKTAKCKVTILAN